MSTGDLSVVMAAYDTEEYIGEAITSVLGNADRLLELIVVDDGSSDGTASVAASFGEPVRVIRQENRGAAGARNTGLAAARAESPPPRRSTCLMSARPIYNRSFVKLS